jgi:hypothetical protein
MSARHTLTHRSTALLAALLIALLALPAVASARTPADDPAPRTDVLTEPSTPAPTVLRTVVKEEAVRVLPIALAGAALIIAIAGTGYTLVRVVPLRQQLGGGH